MKPFPAASPKRILIVDDSAVMRSLLRSVIGSDNRLEVVATAGDGQSALRILDAHFHALSLLPGPDLILLDVEMPILDGLSTLKAIKSKGWHIPVIMCSSLTQRGAKITVEALASGAADYVTKPSGQASREEAIQALAGDLLPKILALTAKARRPLSAAQPAGKVSNVKTPDSARSATANRLSSALDRPQASEQQASSYFSPTTSLASSSLTAPAVVLVGVSTGGPVALETILPALPANFPLPILIVQHMPALFTKLLADRLNEHCALRVVEASDEEPVLAGTAYLAKGDWHMELTATHPGVGIRLTQAAAENHCRPAVNVLLRSAVEVYGAKILAVILTGMGSDGLAGCRLICERGGTILAQDQQTSAIWGMPGAIVEAGVANRVLPLCQIAPEILRLAGPRPRSSASAPTFANREPLHGVAKPPRGNTL